MQANYTIEAFNAGVTVTKSPKVSVCVITYNQEKYIAQCLQSVVDQETDFDFEIIVGDDCSSDSTREIVRGFAEKYPCMFKLISQEKNTGGSANFRIVHEQATGQYIAHLDGDDYFLPEKLQAQVQILDQDKTCNLVWSSVLIETAPGHYHEQNAYFKMHALSRSYTRSDLIKYGTIGVHSSKMYRRLPETAAFPLPAFELIDYFMNVIQVGNGVARFASSKPLSVYRMGLGIASSGSKSRIVTLQSIEYLARLMPRYRLQCNVASGVRLLSDIKNRNPIFIASLRCFIKTFHWCGLFLILKEWKFLKSLTLQGRRE